MLNLYVGKDQLQYVDRIPYIVRGAYVDVDSFVAISGYTTDDDYGIIVVEPHSVYMSPTQLYTNFILSTTFEHFEENLTAEIWDYVRDMKYPILGFRELGEGCRYSLLFDTLSRVYYPYPKGKNVLIAYLLTLINQSEDLDGPFLYDVNRDEYGKLSNVAFYTDLFEQLMSITLYTSLI